ncbi:MAG: ABC transporter ATP-binding protein [Pseudomonadota bacterium]
MTASRSLHIDGLTVRYGVNTAVNNVTLSVRAGEFVAVLGPSGCGKSTLLRAIAGLEPAAAGTIAIGGQDLAPMRPSERGVAFVFQSYALYPHMSCRQNIAAPLAMAELGTLGRLPVVWRLVPCAAEIRRSITKRVDAVAQMLDIEELLGRKPSALSGGQRQRVALGRALVRAPNLFLLDEPLANLDAALRHTTRTELRQIQRRVGATTLFVTHDQAEAMAVADRLVVMFRGEIAQVGTPDEIYRHPATLDVARFLSQPHLNELTADEFVSASGDTSGCLPGSVPAEASTGTVGVRPEHCTIFAPGSRGKAGIPVTVEMAEHAGVDAHLFCRTGAGKRLVARVPSAQLTRWAAGAEGMFQVSPDKAWYFRGAADAAPLKVAA